MSKFDEYWNDKMEYLKKSQLKTAEYQKALIQIADFVSQNAQDIEANRKILALTLDDCPDDIGVKHSYDVLSYRLSAYQKIMSELINLMEN